MIACHNLSHYYGNKCALNNVSFTIETQTPIALVGPNGAGKTTLMAILCGYMRPSEGSASLLGYPAGALELLGQVSALPQDALLEPHTSIINQLQFFARLQGFSPKQSRLEAERVLALVALSDSHNELPNNLSHGMRKRVAIAQSLIGTPKLVMLDEPTAGLDPKSAKVIRQLIEQCKKDTQFLISSHNLNELEKLCDVVLYLNNGSLQQQLNIRDRIAQQVLQIELLTAADKAKEIFTQLNGLLSLKQHSDQEFNLYYDANQFPAFDQTLLSELAKNKIDYKRIEKGLSLEQRLFDQD